MPKFLILMSAPDHYARWDSADQPTRDQYLTDLAAFAAAVRTHGTLHAVLPLLPSPCEIREVPDVGIPITA